MSRYVPSLGAGQSPCPTGGFQGRLGPIWGEASGRGPQGDEEQGDEEQEKALALLLRRFAHNCPQCGQLRGFERALLCT